jgi:riboflavin kinase/FMN adenylyltransferase
MQHFYGLEDVSLKGAWLSIGSFDGVHIGHQQIIKKITAGAHAENAPAVVLTFYPHPDVVLHGPRQSFYLTDPEEKAELLGELGIDAVITHPFSHQIADVEARDFITNLFTHVSFTQLLVGYDFALGHNREGDRSLLWQMGQVMGFGVQVIEAHMADEEIVSSTRIRSLLEAGEVEHAARLLTRPHHVRGLVVKGEGRGRKMGIPTVNLAIPKEQVVAGAGVYVCRAVTGGQTLGAVVNVGVRPTFEVGPVAPRVEAHLLDFEGDIYGREVSLYFLKHLRSEQRFANADALAQQIHLDISEAHQFIKKNL